MERSLKLDLSKNPLFEALTFRGKERDIFEKLVQLKEPKKAKELEDLFGESVYPVLRKMLKAGMIEKTEEGYVLSLKFAEKLRRWAEEWESYVSKMD
jgi:predicted transcriptional regulator